MEQYELDPSRTMWIHFVSTADASLASYRMRTQKPIELLLKLGHKVTIGDEAEQNAHWNIFSKHLRNELGVMLKLDGVTKRAFDIVDDHFDNPEIGNYYRSMASAADVVLTPSINMQFLTKQVTTKEVEVLKEPITFPWYPLGLEAKSLPKLMWFGHTSNIQPLLNELDDMPDDLHLEVITNGIINGGDFTSLAWREGIVEERIGNVDIVLLPIDRERRGAMHKSTNRAVDALRAGRVVITNAVEVYGELSDYIIIADTMAEGIKEYQRYMLHHRKRAREGQKYVLENFNDLVIQKEWSSVLEKHFFDTDDTLIPNTLIKIVEGDNNHAKIPAPKSHS